MVDGLIAIWLLNRRGEVARSAGEPMLNEQWGSYVIPLAGTAFVQVNREVATPAQAREILGISQEPKLYP